MSDIFKWDFVCSINVTLHDDPVTLPLDVV